MASLTIRNLDDDLETALRLRAARHGRSMEEEARQILRLAVGPAAQGGGLAERIGRRFAGLDAEDLSIPARRPTPSGVRLDEPDLPGAPGQQGSLTRLGERPLPDQSANGFLTGGRGAGGGGGANCGCGADFTLGASGSGAASGSPRWKNTAAISAK